MRHLALAIITQRQEAIATCSECRAYIFSDASIIEDQYIDVFNNICIYTNHVEVREEPYGSWHFKEHSGLHR